MFSWSFIRQTIQYTFSGKLFLYRIITSHQWFTWKVRYDLEFDNAMINIPVALHILQFFISSCFRLCQVNGKSDSFTRSSTALLTSSGEDGSFSIKIRQRLDEPLARTSSSDIDGMKPPELEARDFYLNNQQRTNAIDNGFRPISLAKAQVFRPSNPALTNNNCYCIPGPAPPPRPSQPAYYYPGKPTGHFDLTYNPAGGTLSVETSTSHQITSASASTVSSTQFSSSGDTVTTPRPTVIPSTVPFLGTSTTKAAGGSSTLSLSTSVSSKEPFEEESWALLFY